MTWWPSPPDPDEPGLTDRERWHRRAAAALFRLAEGDAPISWYSLEPMEPGLTTSRKILLTPVSVCIRDHYPTAFPVIPEEDFTGALGWVESPADVTVLTDGTTVRPEHGERMTIESLPSTQGINGDCGWTPDEINLLLEAYWEDRLGPVQFAYDDAYSTAMRIFAAQTVTGGLGGMSAEEYFTRHRDLEYGRDEDLDRD